MDSAEVTDPWIPLELALRAHVDGDAGAFVWVEADDGTREKLPAAHFFRSQDELPAVEATALTLCEGSVLDAGAGAGSHALILQARGFDVTALDASAAAVEIMRRRGVRRAVLGDVFTHAGKPVDTLLLMMNGIGLAGTMAGLDRFLERARDLVKPGGQILFDSSDLRRSSDLLEQAGIRMRRRSGRYFGEVTFRMTYRGRMGAFFPWLFVDPGTLAMRCRRFGWESRVAFEEESGDYLARVLYSYSKL